MDINRPFVLRDKYEDRRCGKKFFREHVLYLFLRDHDSEGSGKCWEDEPAASWMKHPIKMPVSSAQNELGDSSAAVPSPQMAMAVARMVRGRTARPPKSYF